MNRVLVNVLPGDWSVHFIGPDGQTRIWPWLLQDEVRKLLRWAIRPRRHRRVRALDKLRELPIRQMPHTLADGV
jgi:hypothetical protein